ncbi:LLM class flavin-dependent oxidoreductase [Nocardioides sp. NPDC051685]|uniref:LLM class flavin-dependent oxidoreductase n=1 Tax=Nocardioides sp. NPDC051685 TaxID=3364334 RepID=UPI00378A2091
MTTLDPKGLPVSVNVPLSVLDLARVGPGETVAEGIDRSVRLAQTADRLGYERVWFSEHHNMPGIASSATALVIQHVAAHTTRIRVGAGGIMLPNHSPLVIAEQFGTLDALYPGRIDLGLGRAPGTDQATMRALRRDGREAGRFPEDVVELHGFLDEESPVPGVKAHPGEGAKVPIYILGSSLFGARLAAQLGLPYAFASHFAPAMLHQAAQAYRRDFDPSAPLAGPGAKPWFMAAVNVVAADDADAADEQRRRFEDEWLRDVLGRERTLATAELEVVRRHPHGQQVLSMLEHSVVGAQDQVVAGLDAFAAGVQADELIVVNMAFDEDHKHRTLEMLAPHSHGAA